MIRNENNLTKEQDTLKRSAWDLYYKGNFREAILMFSTLSNQGSGEGDYGIAQAYYQGCGVRQNYHMARYWLNQARYRGINVAKLEEKLEKSRPPAITISRIIGTIIVSIIGFFVLIPTICSAMWYVLLKILGVY